MDAFKLLTRSTKLTKSTIHAGDNRLGPLPSAGQTISPQLFGRRNESVSDSSQYPIDLQSRKRKRGGLPTKDTGDLPLELDFFNQSTNVPDGHSSQNAVEKQNPSQASIGDGSNKDHRSMPDGPDMTEEECKRYLKLHKIRVTRLASSTQDNPKSSQGKKKSNPSSGRQGKKKHFEELFPRPLLSFEQLRHDYGVSRRLAENVLEQGYRTPTEVQMGSLPLLLRRGQEAVTPGDIVSIEEASGNDLGGGEVDLIVAAPTGSGKTLAFLIPVIEGLLRNKRESLGSQNRNDTEARLQGPKALLIVPTKELMAQIANEGRKLASGTGIKITAMRKGMRVIDHSDATRSEHLDSTHSPDTSRDREMLSVHEEDGENGAVVKAQILVTTPLSFLNAIKINDDGSASKVPSIRHLVLDEADVLLDPLFRDQTLEIWDACSNPALRASLWSATMGSSIEELAMSRIQSRRERLDKDPSRPWQLLRVVIGMKDSAVPNINHRLMYAATEAGKLLALRQLMHPSKAMSKSTPPLRPPFLVFTQTIPRAIALHSELLYDIPPEAGGSDRIAVLHSDLSDTARNRVMTGFRKGEIWVLITTDILSRGVDFRGVNGVVNYDVPNSAAAYIHRGGRTGRAGREGGVAVTLYTKEDIPYIRSVANVIAATERLRGSSGKGEPGLQKWLLDALPKPSKAEKKRLKRHGVQARNAPPTQSGDEKKANEHSRMRISTKSGYDRRLENNRKGAILGSRRRPTTSTRAKDDDFEEEDVDDASDASSEWNGIQD
ncbi:MAG: RNA-dependent ATPase rok1 [Peltula sp. TS41687]|nr:MAG: RNA-dependent ATPase rok1 [Peltula sp. TS41687]